MELLPALGTAGRTGRYRHGGDDQRVRRPPRHGRAPQVRAPGRRVRGRERGREPPGVRGTAGELRRSARSPSAPSRPSWNGTWTGPSRSTALSRTMPATSTALRWTLSRTCVSARSSPGSRLTDRRLGKGTMKFEIEPDPAHPLGGHALLNPSAGRLGRFRAHGPCGAPTTTGTSGPTAGRPPRRPSAPLPCRPTDRASR